MKSRKLLSMFFLAAFLLTGCQNVNVDEKGISLRTEVLANLVLYNEPAYKGKMIQEAPEEPDVPLEPDISPQPTQAPQEEPAGQGEGEGEGTVSTAAGNIKADDDFTAYMDLDGLTIRYASYEIVKSISDGIYEMDADSGHNYYVVYFDIVNQTEENIAAGLSGRGITAQMRGDVVDVYKARLNLLTNDLRYLNQTIMPGEAFRANVIFLVPEDKEFDTIETVIVIGGHTVIYRLK